MLGRSDPARPFAPRVRAVLGPTNTGKTHLAIERLLAHATGIIGFPLRLLARENYDRMVRAKGERHVALITGEEKIVPPEARWFSCTVEAMPLDRAAEFVAVDEIQLCADPDRGHVFTDRLLRARGLVETMVMGAETIRPLLERLVPGVTVEVRPRLSALTGVGHQKLARLPPRSAIVAFSAGEVYAIAEAVRRRRGGCAVVMGRLSPRTRNAQVALYQDGEVDFLVATDAIGMGLNMDVNHVAFAGLRKFDGARPRPLDASEIAQIAGRAGRGMRDGTFGTTGNCPPLTPALIEAVEQHRFDPLETLHWRNSELDFTNPDTLLASLLLPPPAPGLIRGNDASDLETLTALARDPDIHARAGGRGATRLLWDACQVPDFRKLADDTHARLCARIFRHVQDDGRLPDDWIENNLAILTRSDGDIDTLMSRLAGVRVWSFIAGRRDWLGDRADAHAAQARQVEDLLSDALHERLLSRFVDRRAALLTRRLAGDDGTALLAGVTRGGEVVVEGQVVGHARGFGFTPDPALAGDGLKLAERAARRAMHEDAPHRVASLVAAPDGEFALDGGTAAVLWRGERVATLRRGRTALEPLVEPVATEFLDGPERERIRGRVGLFVGAEIARVLAPLLDAIRRGDDAPALRGPLHCLRESAGVLPIADAPPVDAATRNDLRRLGVRAGRFALFIPELLRPRALALRALLGAVATGSALPSLPQPGLVAVPMPADGAERDALGRLGFVPAGAVLLRLDVAERVAGELGWLARRHPAALPPTVASRLGLRAEHLADALATLGFRLQPAEVLADGVYGPPAPITIRRFDRPTHPARSRRPPPRTTDASVAAPVVPAAAEDAAHRRPTERADRASSPPRGQRHGKPGRHERAPAPPPPVAVPRPDSPFAVLARLRLAQR